MSGAISHTLPMLQLVCNLVIVDNSTTNPGGVQPPPSTSPISPIDNGFIPYPEFGAAYKIIDESVTWIEANRRCAEEGAYLAAIDSAAKILAVMTQHTTDNNRHVGLNIMDGSTTWINIHTGRAIAQANLPWAAGQPSTATAERCIVIRGSNLALAKSLCRTAVGDFICEVPYTAPSKLIA